MSQPLFDLGDDAEVRILDPEDADAVFALADAERDRLRTWLSWVDDTRAAADVRGFIERSRASSDDLDALGVYAGGALAGGIGISVDPMQRDGEIGYWLGSAHLGSGLVTKGCRALVSHAFGPMGLHRVTIRAAPDNTRSRAIPERLGFTQEGVMREAGRTGVGYVDLVVYGLLDREWSG